MFYNNESAMFNFKLGARQLHGVLDFYVDMHARACLHVCQIQGYK